MTPASNASPLKESLKKLSRDPRRCELHPQPCRGPSEGLHGGGRSPGGCRERPALGMAGAAGGDDAFTQGLLTR